MVTTYNIQSITFDENSMFLIVNGKEIEVLLEKVSKKLKEANELERMLYKVSPSGYGIHWPLIDEDLSVDALLKIA